MAQVDDQHWLPATFRERGVAVPFTSPQLTGARVRLVDRRCDLVVPHPGGARGVYIFALASLSEFCVPSMHDQGLATRLAALGVPTPGGVRAAARAVAAEGAAGRAAAAAAEAAEAADSQLCASFESLLLGLPQRHGTGQADAERASATRRAIQALAAQLGGTPEAVQVDIGRLAAQLTEAGLDSCSGGKGRCATLLTAMDTLASDVRAWMSRTGHDPAGVQVAAAAAALAVAGRLVLAAAQKPLQDAAALVAAWGASSDAVCARIGRAALLLDGWEHLCLLWRVAETDEARAAAVAEAAVLLPPVPPEAEAWFAAMPQIQAGLRARGIAGALPRAGKRVPSQVVDLLARNERIRALAA